MHSLCIKNLPEKNKKEILRRLTLLVTRFVKIKRITIPHKHKLRQYAFIELNSKEDSLFLLNSLKNVIFFNKELIIEKCKEKLKFKNTKTLFIKLKEEINEKSFNSFISDPLIKNIRHVKIKKIILIDFLSEENCKKFYESKEGKLKYQNNEFILECL